MRPAATITVVSCYMLYIGLYLYFIAAASEDGVFGFIKNMNQSSSSSASLGKLTPACSTLSVLNMFLKYTKRSLFKVFTASVRQRS